jgi:hypothetical protein
MIEQTVITIVLIGFATLIVVRRVYAVLAGMTNRRAAARACGGGCSGCKMASTPVQTIVPLSLSVENRGAISKP